jgi:dihydrodipicolinate reductase
MDMAALYARHKVPFVMGTTGGDRQKLVADTEARLVCVCVVCVCGGVLLLLCRRCVLSCDTAQNDFKPNTTLNHPYYPSNPKQKTNTQNHLQKAAGVYAVIAPQMGKQVVAFQAAMELMAERFPGAFGGYALEVVESHQSGKKDTSGTAKAVVASLEKLGAPLGPNGIEMVRERGAQTGRMGVPEEHLGGHAFHTYRLTSPDGTVGFEFQHNVCGRTIYAEGTVDAVLFLAAQVRAGASKRVYNMIDVLRAGAMR